MAQRRAVVGIPALGVLGQGRIRELLELEAQEWFLGRSNRRQLARTPFGRKRASGLALSQPAFDAAEADLKDADGLGAWHPASNGIHHAGA